LLARDTTDSRMDQGANMGGIGVCKSHQVSLGRRSSRNQGNEQSIACMLVSAYPSRDKSSSTFVITKGDREPIMCCYEIQYVVRSL
jgi:hypothetical protein